MRIESIILKNADTEMGSAPKRYASKYIILTMSSNDHKATVMFAGLEHPNASYDFRPHDHVNGIWSEA